MGLGRARAALQRAGLPALRGANQLINASGALAALDALRARLPVTAQAVRNGLAWWTAWALPGRSRPAGADAGRGAQPARGGRAGANLDAMGSFLMTHGVFGAMADKDIAAILRHMAR
jgi:dihydrofolate synthase/folylpolyglutamate synthase